jgi:glucose-fructose oxidoreductase
MINKDSDRQTRRDFLKRSTSLMAGTYSIPYIITSNVLGSGGIRPPSERITIGHIGVGGMGGGHVRGFAGRFDSQSIATCDPAKDRRETWAKYIDDSYAQKSPTKNYKSCTAYNDFRQLLARDDLDAIVIATPCHWHVPIAIAAARAGKDIYVEKPLGLALSWDMALRETAARYGTVVQYGTQQRSGRDFRFVCELVRNGRIGKLEKIFVWCAPGQPGGSLEPMPIPEGFDYDLWLGPSPMVPFNEDRCFKRGKNWIADYALGFIAGWGAHPLDIAQWGNDADHTSPVEYEGSGIFPKDGLFDTAISWDIKCRYENDVELHFVSADVAKPIVEKYGIDNSYGTMFIGSEGWLNVDRRHGYAGDPSMLRSVIGPDEIRLKKSLDHKQNFIDCIRSRSVPVSPITAAVRSDTISHLCDIAMRLDRKIKWDPVNETVIGDEAASRMLSRPMRSPWTL